MNVKKRNPMKILTLSALCALLSVNAFASEVPDCYREADVTPGQFVILMDQYIRDAGKEAVINSLADPASVNIFPSLVVGHSSAENHPPAMRVPEILA